MTDIPLTDYTETLERLSKIYGCFGIITVDGWNNFVEQWFLNNGETGAMDGAVVVVNSSAGLVTSWAEDIFNHET